MKKILVPIDFSPASRNASEYAVSLAKALGTTVELLHVYLEPAPAIDGPMAWVPTATFQEENEEWIQEEVQYLKEKYGVEVTGEVVAGLKKQSINEQAKKSDAGLVAMGMKEAKRQKFIASTVFSAIRRTRRPVLVVPEGVPFLPIRNIVLAADFNGVKDTACFDPLLELVEKLGANLQVVHVAGKEAVIKPEELPGKIQLGRVLSEVTYWYHELDENRIEESILQFTQNHPADLLVMVAHRHSLFDRLFGMVYTRGISSRTTIPLLILDDKKG